MLNEVVQSYALIPWKYWKWKCWNKVELSINGDRIQGEGEMQETSRRKNWDLSIVLLLIELISIAFVCLYAHSWEMKLAN